MTIHRRFSGGQGGNGGNVSSTDIGRIAVKVWKEQMIRRFYRFGLPWVNGLRDMLWNSVDVEDEGTFRWFEKRLRDLARIEHILMSQGRKEPSHDLKITYEGYFRDKCLARAAKLAASGQDTINKYGVHTTSDTVLVEVIGGVDQDEERMKKLTPIWEL